MGRAACGAPREPGKTRECLTYPTGANTSCARSHAAPAGLEREHPWAARLRGPGWGCAASPRPPVGSDPARVSPVSASKLRAPAILASGMAVAAEERVLLPRGPVPPIPGEPRRPRPGPFAPQQMGPSGASMHNSAATRYGEDHSPCVHEERAVPVSVGSPGPGERVSAARHPSARCFVFTGV